MWKAVIDSGLGIVDDLCEDTEFWQLLVKLGGMSDAIDKVKRGGGEVLIKIFYQPEASWAYRDQVPRSGKYRDVVLDTVHKAKGYVEWQYERGLITQQEQENALRIIEVEFAGT